MMASMLLTERLARASARRPWWVVLIWVIALVPGMFLASQIDSVLTNEAAITSEPESVKADHLLEEKLRGPRQATETVIVRSEDMTIDDPRFRTRVEQLTAQLRGIEGGLVGSATNFYESGNGALVSADRHTTLIPTQLTTELVDAQEDVEPLLKVVRDANGAEGFEVLTVGPGSVGFETGEIVDEDLMAAEIFGLPITLIILLVVFGAAVAAGIPLILAIASIILAVGAATAVGQVFELSIFVQNMIIMIGLAVGIDYSLFVVQRFREERRLGLEKHDAIGHSAATASRSVLFSGFAVIVALFGMFIVPSSIFRSLAVGAIFVVIFAVLAALTLLPAVLSLVGDKVNSLRVPFLGRGMEAGTRNGFWGRTATFVTAHPWPSVIIAAAVLVAAALPYFSADMGFSGVGTLPEKTDSRRAFDILDSEFSAGLIQNEEIVVDAPNVNGSDVQGGIARLVERLRSDQSFGAAQIQTNEAGDLALISVPIAGQAASTSALDAVKRLRDDYIPTAFNGVDANVYVTGPTASSQDFFDIVEQYTPIVFAMVLGLSFLILLVMFRSIVVPIKALIMNLLSVGAAYGLLVAVFQHGFANEILGFQQVERIEAWLPLFLFSVLFGLSMDYHVFLLSRIRERFLETGNNTEAIIFGVRSTAGIITGAALIMVTVFAAFALGETVFMQQMGFGLAVAVALDATIIRTILVPASMKLLGDANWYMPGWLSWLPEVAVEKQGRPRAARGSGEQLMSASSGGWPSGGGDYEGNEIAGGYRRAVRHGIAGA